MQNGLDAKMANEQVQMQAFAKIVKTSEDLTCVCGGLNFLNVFRIKKLSGLLTGTGKDTLMPISVYACADCGTIPPDMLEKLQHNDVSPEPQGL